MSHILFIFAAYAVTFAVVGVIVGTTVLRHRALKRALARFGEDAERAA